MTSPGLNTSYTQLIRRTSTQQLPVAIRTPAEFCSLPNLLGQFGSSLIRDTESRVVRHGAYGLFWPSYPERLFIMNIPLFYERKTRSDIIIIYYRTQSLNGLFNAVIGEILLSTTINRVATNTSCGEKSLDQLRRNASCPECFIYGINYHLPLLMLLLLTLLRTNTTAG